jgi:hypothetical protein
MKASILARYLVLLQLGVAAHACAEPMKNYTIDFPEHILRYSLPREIADKMEPWVQEKQLSQFSPTDKNFVANGYQEIAGTLHDFNGPFWVGAYGSLKFYFIVRKRSPDYHGDITNLDGLDRYIHWLMNDGNPAHIFKYDRVMLGGSQWIRRLQDNFSDLTVADGWQRQELEIISIPIDNDMFLDVSFIVMEWVPGSAKKWKQKAEELRDAIKATIVLEPKSAGNQ